MNMSSEEELELRAGELWKWFQEEDNLDDLEGTIQCEREMLALRPPGHSERLTRLFNLAGALHARFN